MTRQADDRVRFVLGLLPDDERDRLEREALADDGLYEQLVAAEDELFYDYARGALPDAEERAFEERFHQTDEGKRRLAQARAILETIESRAPRPRVIPWLATAAAVLVALTALRSWRPDRGAVSVTSPSPRPVAPAAGASLPRAASTVLALTLAPGTVRGEGDAPTVRLTPGVSEVRLVLELPAGIRRAEYAAALVDSQGRPTLRREALRPATSAGKSTVALVLPAEELPEDDYELTVEAGGEPVADYAFGVRRD